ncbi:hypothetical protein M378DRAFT_307655 [Amanita muscaria Koide BX008]|uniref:Uncharacterized protein n=1 Tax=Amanita muscaria (strain Koide BX008) TaxID=946122 RepID=A0A0C2WBP0_AMAMK|nr:hypothetical protein M378DRAFT_307655 [Amanita muscaria Koide BX008]
MEDLLDHTCDGMSVSCNHVFVGIDFSLRDRFSILKLTAKPALIFPTREDGGMLKMKEMESSNRQRSVDGTPGLCTSSWGLGVGPRPHPVKSNNVLQVMSEFKNVIYSIIHECIVKI